MRSTRTSLDCGQSVVASAKFPMALKAVSIHKVFQDLKLDKLEKYKKLKGKL